MQLPLPTAFPLCFHMYLQRADVPLPNLCFTTLTRQALSCPSLMITGPSFPCGFPPALHLFPARDSLDHFGKNIGKSHISNIKQQLIDRLELYRSMRKDKRKEARGMFSVRKKCPGLDVTKRKQGMYSKFLPQELSFPKG